MAQPDNPPTCEKKRDERELASEGEHRLCLIEGQVASLASTAEQLHHVLASVLAEDTPEAESQRTRLARALEEGAHRSHEALLQHRVEVEHSLGG
jgi:hypothetical protein